MVSGLPCAARAGQRFEPMGEAPVAPQAGEVMLVCGTRPLEVLRQAGLASKNRAITSLRETPLRPKAEGGFYLVGYDPAIVHSEPDKKQIIDWDVRPAVRLLTTGSLAPEVRAYRWVGGFSELIGAINCTEGPVDVAMDTETMGTRTGTSSRSASPVKPGGRTVSTSAPATTRVPTDYQQAPAPRLSGACGLCRFRGLHLPVKLPARVLVGPTRASAVGSTMLGYFHRTAGWRRLGSIARSEGENLRAAGNAMAAPARRSALGSEAFATVPAGFAP